MTPIALRAGGRAQLHRHRAEAARSAPDQHVVAGPQDVRAMAEQHAIGGGEGQRVAGALFPGQVLGARHQLPALHLGELGEGAVRRLVAPDALRGREHRVAAVALLVVAVILVAMDDDLVAHLPALHLGADRPDDAGGVGAGDVILGLVHVERRDRLAQAGPDAVVIDARRHHEHDHLVGIGHRGRHHLDLHALLGRAMALAPDRPGIHLGRQVPHAAGSRRPRRGPCGPRYPCEAG